MLPLLSKVYMRAVKSTHKQVPYLPMFCLEHDFAFIKSKTSIKFFYETGVKGSV